jgi:O-antigen/teichoic acid export membrane protein
MSEAADPEVGEPSPAPSHALVKRRLVINTAAAYIGTALTIVVGFVATPFVVRGLGASAYGVAALLDVFAITGWSSLLELGIQSSATRFVAVEVAHDQWEAASRVVSTAFALFLLIGLTAAVGIALAANALATEVFNVPVEYQHSLNVAFLGLAIALAFQFPGLAVAAAVEGLQRSDLVTVARVSVSVVGTLVAVTVVLLGAGLTAYMLVLVLSPLVGVGVLSFWLVRSARRLRITPLLFSWRTFRVIGRMSGQIAVGRVASLAFANTDKIIIGIMLTSTALAQYSIAAKLYSLVFVAGILMNSAVVAPASHLYALHDHERLRDLVIRGTKYGMVAAIPFGAAMFVVAPDLAQTWVGDSFEPAGVTTRIWLASIVVPTVTGVPSLVLLGMNRVLANMLLWVGAAVVNIGVSVALAPTLGVNGVVLGTTVAYFVVGPPFVWHMLRVLEIPWSRFVRGAIVPALPVTGVALILAWVGLSVVGTSAGVVGVLAVLGVAVVVPLAIFVVIGLPAAERASLIGSGWARFRADA